MSNENPLIRPATFRDVEGIYRIIKSYPEELVPRSLSDIIQRVDRFVVCERGGEVAGTVSWQILPEIRVSKQHLIEIVSLAVDARSRGLGIGKMLVAEALRRIRPLHPSSVIALTFTPEFFRKLGFVETPKEDLVHKLYMGCINCTKYDSPFTCPEVAMKLTLDPSEG